MITRADSIELAKVIDRLDFGTVFRIHNGNVVEVANEYAPSVYHDDTEDVVIDGGTGPEWSCFTGLTGQYSYNGAVMHPSEYVGAAIAEHIADYASECEENGGDVVFALVLVVDMEDGEDIGWAIAYRETVN